MKKINTIILLVFISNISFAEDKVQELQIGQISPYTGILMPQSKADQIKMDLINADYNKAVNESLNKSIELYKSNETLYQNKVNVLTDQNNNLAKNLYEERSLSAWEKFGLFGLGILATVGAGFAIKKASQ